VTHCLVGKGPEGSRQPVGETRTLLRLSPRARSASGPVRSRTPLAPVLSSRADRIGLSKLDPCGETSNDVCRSLRLTWGDGAVVCLRLGFPKSGNLGKGDECGSHHV
jgi:hypothetical protein